MKTETIEARDSDGNLLGTEVIQVPETVAELLTLKKDEEVVDLAMRSIKIDVQRTLRAKARGPVKMTENEKAFKKLSPEMQAKLLEALKQ
jgi:hypothetical protein